MIQPKTRRVGKEVIIECPDEEAAKHCLTGLNKALNSPFIRKQLMKRIK